MIRPYVPGRRRPDDRLERDRPDGRAARARAARRAGPRHLARARHVALDELRHGRPPEGGRGRGSRDRARPPLDAAREQARRAHLRRCRRSAGCRSARGASACSASSRRSAKSGATRRAGASARPLSALPPIARPGSPASARSSCVVSDFRGPRDWRTPMLQLAARHEVIAVEIRDPREQELANAGELWLIDAETGRHSGSTRAAPVSGHASPRPPRPSGATSPRRSRPSACATPS